MVDAGGGDVADAPAGVLQAPLPVLLVAVEVEAGVEAARPLQRAPAQRQVRAPGLNRYTPDFDRKTVEDALRLGWYPRFVTTIRNAPEVGQLVLGGGQPYAIRYARERVEGGGRTIVVVTDRPVFFLGGGRETSKPRAGYEVAVVQIQLDAKGQGKGTIATAARVRPDGDGGVLLDDYNEQLITLTDITRKAS